VIDRVKMNLNDHYFGAGDEEEPLARGVCMSFISDMSWHHVSRVGRNDGR
jgi:hypothetical protein